MARGVQVVTDRGCRAVAIGAVGLGMSHEPVRTRHMLGKTAQAGEATRRRLPFLVQDQVVLSALTTRSSRSSRPWRISSPKRAPDQGLR
jgi:hypothetical protein